MAYRRREGLLSSVLSPAEVETLILLEKKGVTKEQIAKQYGIHRNTVRNVIIRAKETGLYNAVGSS